MTAQLVPLVSGSAVAFWICAPLMVLGALGMVLLRKAVYSALSLALVMVNLAVLYASLGSPFLFVVQIIVYTGAIMMLFLFVVMLVGVDTDESMVETIKGHKVASILAGLGLVILLVAAIGQSIWTQPVGVDLANAEYGGNVPGLAALLFNRYVVAFEATAALLITAAVGAMVLAHGERLRPRFTQTMRAAERVKAYVNSGTHPGPRPSSGVFARHNSIDTPALLPDGSVAASSVSEVLTERVGLRHPTELGAAAKKAFAELEAVQGSQAEEDE